ncbi:hypothetical protein K438DRAFT_2033613 [Mycena galopus ATCC 62051]|nr:hypothetical protein K438DRAFT_2033613 [Mycena galopus ATCC 62051]
MLYIEFCLNADASLELLRETQGQLRTREGRPEKRGDPEPSSPILRNENHCIGAPSCLSDATIKTIRTDLGCGRKPCSAFRTCIRNCLRAASLNWDDNWKSQSTTKVSYAFNAIGSARQLTDTHPSLKFFRTCAGLAQAFDADDDGTGRARQRGCAGGWNGPGVGEG